MLPLRKIGFGDTLEREIIGFRRTTGKDDFCGTCANSGGDGFPSSSYCRFRRPSILMSGTSWIAKMLGKIWQHCLEDARIYRRCGMSIEINW